MLNEVFNRLETHLVVSQGAEMTRALETDYTKEDVYALADVVHSVRNVAQDLDLVVDVVADFAGQVDNGGMFAAGMDARGFSFFFREAEDQAEEDEDGDAAPDIAPNAGAALFLVGGEEDFAQGVALPVVYGCGG